MPAPASLPGFAVSGHFLRVFNAANNCGIAAV